MFKKPYQAIPFLEMRSASSWTLERVPLLGETDRNYSNFGPLLMIQSCLYEICHIYLKWEPFCSDKITHLTLYLASISIWGLSWLPGKHQSPFPGLIQTDSTNNLGHADADDCDFLHEKITMLTMLMMMVRAKTMNAEMVMMITWTIVSSWAQYQSIKQSVYKSKSIW